MTDKELDDAERMAADDDKPMAVLLGLAVSEIRRLKHELADPNYQYASGRIHRMAILTRESKIDKLTHELIKLKSSK